MTQTQPNLTLPLVYCKNTVVKKLKQQPMEYQISKSSFSNGKREMIATREDVTKQLYNDQNCEETETQQLQFITHTVEVLNKPSAESISNKQREKKCNHHLQLKK